MHLFFGHCRYHASIVHFHHCMYKTSFVHATERLGSQSLPLSPDFTVFLAQRSILSLLSGIRSLGPHGGSHWCYKGFCYLWARDPFYLNRGWCPRKGSEFLGMVKGAVQRLEKAVPANRTLTKGKWHVSNKNALPSFIFPSLSTIIVAYLLLKNLVHFFFS